MTYPAGEALVLARLRDLSDFDTTNSGRGKWLLLSSGNSNYYAILKGGERNMGDIGFGGQAENDERTVIQLWYRYERSGTTYTDLLDLIATARQQIDKYPHLGQTTPTIRGAKVIQVREIQEMWNRDGGLEWLMAELVVSWQQDEAVSLQE